MFIKKKFFLLLLICNVANADFFNFSAGKYPPLIKAAELNDVQKAEKLISQGHQLSVRTIGNQTALHVAVLAGSADMVKWLIEHEVSPLVQDTNGSNPIDFAREKKDRDGSIEKIMTNFVGFMIKERELIISKDMSGLTKHLEKDIRNYNILHILSITNNYEELNKVIKKHSKKINAQTKLGHSPLHKVIPTGNKELAKLLLDNGALVDSKDIYLATPLYYAIEIGKLDLAKYLIERGANTKATNSYNGGDSILKSALRKKDEDIISLVKGGKLIKTTP